MAPAPLTVTTLDSLVTSFNTLCTKSEGRDKLGRFVQYGCRTLIGLLSMRKLQAGSQFHLLHEQAGNVMKQLASARRCNRWCKEFPVIQQIIASLPTGIPQSISISSAVEKSAELLQKLALATFMICDHIGWLKQVKILKGGKRAGTGTIQLGLKFFGASNFLGAVLALKKIRDTPEGEKGKKEKLVETCFKHTLLVFQCLHLSRTYETHDAFVGVLGMITSAIDVRTQWPEQKQQKQQLGGA